MFTKFSAIMFSPLKKDIDSLNPPKIVPFPSQFFNTLLVTETPPSLAFASLRNTSPLYRATGLLLFASKKEAYFINSGFFPSFLLVYLFFCSFLKKCVSYFSGFLCPTKTKTPLLTKQSSRGISSGLRCTRLLLWDSFSSQILAREIRELLSHKINLKSYQN